MTCQKFVSQAGQRVLIAQGSGRALKLLRGHVERGKRREDARGPFRLDQAGQQEIGQEHLAITLEENILRLKVRVYYLLRMSKLQRLASLAQNSHHFLQGQKFACR